MTTLGIGVQGWRLKEWWLSKGRARYRGDSLRMRTWTLGRDGTEDAPGAMASLGTCETDETRGRENIL